MEDKLAKELVIQLKRIADALEHSNKATAASEKRSTIIDKLQEKNLRADLREKLSLETEEIKRTSPRLESEDGSI